MTRPKNIRCYAKTASDISRNLEKMRSSYTTVLVIPTADVLSNFMKEVDGTSLDMRKTSINIMTLDNYIAASNWHIDEEVN